MNGFLVETNVLFELPRGHPHGAVLAWPDATPADQLFLSAVTVGEVQIGVENTRTINPVRAGEIETRLELMIGQFDVLPMDVRTFRTFARLKHRQPEHLFMDAMIAATALTHGLVVATRNVKDFEVFGAAVVNPFDFR